ncbi:MAG: hypothetical protein EOP82_08465 [Variovorax sp.]|nr:MAG: hypothetical protein EOP82_08465 [Variovorax sp.]
MKQAPHHDAPIAPRPAAAKAWRRGAALAALLGSLCLFPQPEAAAVLTTVALGSGQRSITLQVGNATGIDNVVFNVTGTNVSPSATPVTNTTPVDIRITANRVSPSFEPWITLTADSSGGLACVGGTGCGSTVIPFNSISWQSTNADASGLDIQDGAFNGTATQQLARYRNNYRDCRTYDFFCAIGWVAYDYYDTNMHNALRFTYANGALYPAGQYRGRVTFTATML